MTSSGATSPEQRDRDRSGRPRSNRPRDGLGRPLARGAVGAPRQPEGQVRTPGETIRVAQRLLDTGMPFHAHEVFEDAWKSAPGDERELWRGLAQLAVGVTHDKRGNARGAQALLRRGADTVRPYAADAPYDLDIATVAEWADAAARAAAEGGGLPPMPRLRRAARTS